MKQLTILIAFCLLIVSNVNGQKSKGKDKDKQPEPTQTQPQPPPQVEQKPQQTESVANLLGEHFARKYSLATRWNDADAAKDALYDLIAEYPGSDSLILSLAYYYFDKQSYPSTVLICQDLLSRNPKNLEALEMAASGYEGLNILDRALQSYESMFLLTSNTLALYKMTFLQFQLKKYPESLTNADILLTKPEVDTQKVVFNDPSGKAKEYKMKVAVLNLKGMLYRDQADKVNARKFFDEALKEAPDFVPARENLAALTAAPKK